MVWPVVLCKITDSANLTGTSLGDMERGTGLVSAKATYLPVAIWVWTDVYFQRMVPVLASVALIVTTQVTDQIINELIDNWFLVVEIAVVNNRVKRI